MRCPPHSPNVFFKRGEVLRFQQVNINHHVNFFRAVFDCAARLEGFGAAVHRAERKADNRADRDVRTLESARHVGDPAGIDADRFEIVLDGFVAELVELRLRGVRLEERMINVLREVGGKYFGGLPGASAATGVPLRFRLLR